VVVPIRSPSVSPSVSPSFLPTTQYEYRVETDRDTWINHHIKAQEWGGNLVSIHSSADSNIISNLMIAHLAPRHSIWIGGIHNVSNTTIWEWIDGTVFDYTNWDEGQPSTPNHNNSNRRYHVRKADQTRYDGQNNHEHYAIYKRKNV